MLATFTRSGAIFFVLVFSFFAAASSYSQSRPDRPRSASASSEAQSDGSALSASSDSFTVRTIAANPVTWMEQCAAQLPGLPVAFALSLHHEFQPWENDFAADRDLPSQSTACAAQQFLAQRASLRNSAGPQLSASPNSASRSAVSSALPPSAIPPLTSSPSSVSIAALRVLAPAADPVSAQLSSLGKPGAPIARARAVVLAILASDNACTEWYLTKDRTPALTFQSLTFSIDRHGQQTILQSPLPNSLALLRQPYVARATQDGGPYTEITVNANGAFYRQQSSVEKFAADGGPGLLAGTHLLTVGWYTGTTLEARVATLFHEFGHILDLLPPDSDDLDGRSARNTDEVLRHCRSQIESASKLSRHSAKN